MHIQIETKVSGNYLDVLYKFDRQLFEALLPKNARVEIVDFTGSKKGDRVHLKFLSPIKTEWISDIIEDGSNEEEAYFIDEGSLLPPGLKYWRHKHIVRKITDTESLIIDDITFKGLNQVISLLLYPGIYFSFAGRKKIYQQYFSKL